MKRFVASMAAVSVLLSAATPVLSQKTRSVRSQKTEVAALKTASFDVKLAETNASSDGNGVLISWKAQSETKNLGFQIYRTGAKGTALVDRSFVGGAALVSAEDTTNGREYSFFDGNGQVGDSYFIESIGTGGERQSFGPIDALRVDQIESVNGSDRRDPSKPKRPSNPELQKSAAELPLDLKAEVEANSLAPNLVGQRWVAAQPGVKIGVKQEGIYRVSRAELQAGGFDVNVAGNFWQLYVDGNEQSIIVGPGDSYVEFYGKGLDTAETATKIYYLVAGPQNGKRMVPTVLRSLSGNVRASNYRQVFSRKERQIYISSNVLNGEQENFFSNVAIIGSNSPTPATTTLNFDLTGVDFSSPSAVFSLKVQGITSTLHQIVAKVNGNALGPINGSGINLMTGEFPIPTSFLVEGQNSLQLQTFGGSGDINLTESFSVAYARTYLAAQNRLSFYSQNYRTSTVSGFTGANIRVFDLTYPDSPAVLTGLQVTDNGGNFSVKIPAHRGRVMFASEDSAVLSASTIVANAPSTLATAANNGEMVILTHSSLATEANDWANYRRSEGLTVKVVNVEDAYDEFSYGALSTTGITDFLTYAKNNWQTAPNYVLLIGDATYDFRNYENRAFNSFVPTKRVDTVYEETGSDEALCDFNNDGLAEIAVGRIPARTGAVVTQLLSKTQNFEANVGGAMQRGALFASDLPNGYDFEAVGYRLATNLPASMPKTHINRAVPNSKALLINAVNVGPYLVNYSGHGSTGSWDGNWFTINDAIALQNGQNHTLYFMLTCLNGYFLRSDADSLGEAILKSTNGGGVATWASTGKTTPDVQEAMATRFYSQLNTGNMNRIGDLIKDAKQQLIGGRDVRLSWALLGDPALKIKP